MSTNNRKLRAINDQNPIGWESVIAMVVIALILLAVKYGDKIDSIL